MRGPPAALALGLLLNRFRRGSLAGGGKLPLDLSDRATKIEAFVR
jgi:hypothetical protein